MWNWIDLDIKRLEPYYQLCSPHGALAEDSLLLQYPFDFIILVPFEAARRKHWSVFTAGLAALVVLWTLTPLQAGIFATESRIITTSIPFVSSTSYLSISRQNQLSALYAQHAYNIAWLGEKLPAYATADFVLSPFVPNTTSKLETDEIWNGTTRLYSVDVTCETPILYEEVYGWMYNSSYGCSIQVPAVHTSSNNDTSKYLNALYVGYQNENGMADYYLSTGCPSNASHTFLARIIALSPEAILNDTFANKNEVDELKNSTALFCQPEYFEQTVNASIVASNRSVISVTPITTKHALPSDMFNISRFEWALNSGQDQDYFAEGDFPTTYWPDQKSHFIDTPLDMGYLPKMVPFSFAALQMPSLDDYNDPDILRKSYQAAYRLLFARQMSDVLQSDFAESSDEYVGSRSFKTHAVILVPEFAYAVEALLAVAMVFNLSIMYFTMTRRLDLHSDPSTLDTAMSLTADDPSLLSMLSELDKDSNRSLFKVLKGSKFRLEWSKGISLYETAQITTKQANWTRELERVKGVQPPELQWYSGVLFLTIQILCIVSIEYLFHQVKTNNGNYGQAFLNIKVLTSKLGIPLPSENRFVRQLVENYIPTAIATFMEPFWTLLNRLICVLQPFEELRKGKASSKKSISLDYTAIPPQLTLFRALQARHFLLAAICLMTLLANVLSVAFSGIFYEDPIQHETEIEVQALMSLPFRSLNGTAAPFNSNITQNWQGGTTNDEFYIAMSNAVASSKLPPWTDSERFYFPVDLPTNTPMTTNYTISTTFFGADLECQELQEYEMTRAGHDPQTSTRHVTIDFRVSENDVVTNCTADYNDEYYKWNTHGLSAEEIVIVPSSSTTCQQYLVAGWFRGHTFNETVVLDDKTLVLCRPRLVTGEAEVTVTSEGSTLRSDVLKVADGSLPEYFTTTPMDLVLQAHQFIVDAGGLWHNTSFANDWMNYLMAKSDLGDKLLRPDAPPPTFLEAAPHLIAIYNKLFAILLGHNKDILFTSSMLDAQPLLGKQIQSETRIFLSFTAFVIAEIILCLYATTTILMYVCRPWRILPRLPTTLASVVAFFAASYAVREFENTTEMSRLERTKMLVQMGHKWAFGNFMGTDRRIHIGVEREPFVTVLENEKIPSINRIEGKGRD